jgi:hypothetical protein
MDRVTVPEAARILGIKEESVRKRLSRGKLRADKDEDGRLLVYVVSTGTVRDEYEDQSRTTDNDLVVELRSRIAYLERQVEEERDARRRADTLLARLMDRVPELEAPRDERASPETVEQEPERAEPRSDAPGAREGVRRPWWRRVLGGS